MNKGKKNSLHKPCKDLFLNYIQTAGVYCLDNQQYEASMTGVWLGVFVKET